jgi:nitroreductase/ferredoxin
VKAAESPGLPCIDGDLCISCGACVAVCPDRILRIEAAEKAPADAAGRVVIIGERCMQCGHCYAVCPVEAIATPFLDNRLDYISDRARTCTAARSLFSLMRNRRSCRSFKTAALARPLLEDLVTAGITAPSGTNSQGWEFVVLARRKDVVALGSATADYYRKLNRQAARPLLRLALRLLGNDALENYYQNYYQSVKDGLRDWDRHGVDRLFHGAPAAIVVAGSRSASCPAEDALLATQNILLVAEALGLGTCLIGFAVEAARRDRSIPRLLGLGRDEGIYAVIGLGYPDVAYLRPAGRKPKTARFVNLADSGS